MAADVAGVVSCWLADRSGYLPTFVLRERMLRLLEEKIATPLGPLWVICDEQFRLRAVEWEEYSERMVQLLDIHYRKESYERISATNQVV